MTISLKHPELNAAEGVLQRAGFSRTTATYVRPKEYRVWTVSDKFGMEWYHDGKKYVQYIYRNSSGDEHSKTQARKAVTRKLEEAGISLEAPRLQAPDLKLNVDALAKALSRPPQALEAALDSRTEDALKKLDAWKSEVENLLRTSIGAMMDKLADGDRRAKSMEDLVLDLMNRIESLEKRPDAKTETVKLEMEVHPSLAPLFGLLGGRVSTPVEKKGETVEPRPAPKRRGSASRGGKTLTEVIVQALRAHGPLTTEQVTDAFPDEKRSSIWGALNTLVKRGLIEQEKRNAPWRLMG